MYSKSLNVLVYWAVEIEMSLFKHVGTNVPEEFEKWKFSTKVIIQWVNKSANIKMNLSSIKERYLWIQRVLLLSFFLCFKRPMKCIYSSPQMTSIMLNTLDEYFSWTSLLLASSIINQYQIITYVSGLNKTWVLILKGNGASFQRYIVTWKCISEMS